MKKVNLCVWLILFMTCSAFAVSEANDFSCYFFNGQKQRKIEQNTHFALTALPDWTAKFTEQNSEDYRIDFDQDSRNSILQLSLEQNKGKFGQQLESGYEYIYDYSNLESLLQPYTSKTGFLGYGAFYYPLDSLKIQTDLKGYLRNEQDRYKEDHKLGSEGFFGKFNSAYGQKLTSGILQLNCNLEGKEMDWERYRLYSAGFSDVLQRQTVSVSAFADASYKAEDIYVLTAYNDRDNSYRKQDSQIKRSLNAIFSLTAPLQSNLDVQLTDTYNMLNYQHRKNQVRNSGDYNNQAGVIFSYKPTNNVIIRSESQYDYYLKDLSHLDNSRITDTRKTGLDVLWEYNPYDSLLLDYTIELRRTSYPDSRHKLDSDYLNQIYKLNWTMFWKDRLRLANKLMYWRREERYIDTELSANNNRVGSVQWQPEADVLIGDCFLLEQDYLIRADYTNYIYSDWADFNLSDTFYRQLRAGCKLIYDSSPLAAKVDLPKWNLLPYRTRTSDAGRIEAGFTWEKNETYIKKEDLYSATGKDISRIVSLLMQKQFGILIFQFYPQYRWGSWTEYNFLFSSALQMTANSILEAGINPIGPLADELDWRVYCSLNLLF
ncbi:MAG: hypothetical protein ACE14O_05765 [Candidatus Cloacimonadaceae bacterium]